MIEFMLYNRLNKLNEKIIFLLLSLLLLMGSVYSQRNNTFTVPIQQLYTGEAINIYDLRDKSTKGSVYWEDEWRKGAILMTNEEKLDQYEIKYDIQSWILEINTPEGVKVLPGGKVSELYLDQSSERDSTSQRSHLIHLKNYFGKNIPSQGFYQLLVEGKYSLVKNYELEILNPNYIPALDAGESGAKIVKKEQYFIINNEELVKLPRKKKKKIEILSVLFPEIPTYIRDNNLKLNKADDMIKIITYFNQ